MISSDYFTPDLQNIKQQKIIQQFISKLNLDYSDILQVDILPGPKGEFGGETCNRKN